MWLSSNEQTRNHEDVGLNPSLTQWIKGYGIFVRCGVCHKHGTDLAMLWLLHRSVAAVLIQPLDWELPYATVRP